MPRNQDLIDELSKSIDSIKRLGAILDASYNDPDFSTLTRKPVIQMMVHATNYLSSNVQILLDGYLRDTK